MATHQETLASLIAANTGELTPERLNELSATAKTLASLGPAAPPIAPKPKADPKAAARARLAELDAAPLPSHASDAQKCTRAHERTKLLQTALNWREDTDTGWVTYDNGSTRGDAA